MEFFPLSVLTQILNVRSFSNLLKIYVSKRAPKKTDRNIRSTFWMAALVQQSTIFLCSYFLESRIQKLTLSTQHMRVGIKTFLHRI